MSIVKLEDTIVETFSPMWELNDRAHRVEHFSEVFQTGLDINKRLGLGMSKKLTLFAAYFHDLFAWSRENHHLLSEEFIRGTCHPLINEHLNQEERLLVAGACRKHRASNREEFSNFFEEFINASDRERPKDVNSFVDRAIKYRQDKFKHMSHEEMEADAIQHIKEKYGHGGYARYPAIYVSAYGEEFKRLKDAIALL